MPLYCFADDIAASGGYFLLSIGDKVYVQNSSLIGSIGAKYGWIGFKNILDKHKIDYRKIKSNTEKAESWADKWEHLNEKEKKSTEEILGKIHATFISHVENNRNEKITVATEERKTKLYNADVFLGKTAVEYGLADEIGSY